MFFKQLLEYGVLWILGGALYFAIELLFRGYSHWTMFALGGVCMAFFAFQGKAMHWCEPMWIQIIRCTIFVTACEFITGLIVNKWFHLGVWDYSNQPFHLFGQICLPFAILFSGLCAVGIPLSGYLLHWIFDEEKPKYRVL